MPIPSFSTAVYKLIGVGVVIVTLLGSLHYYINGLKNTIDEQATSIKSLNKDQESCKLEIALKKSNIHTLETSLDKVNNEISELNIKYNKQVKFYNEWKAKPPEIRYKYIYKHVKSDKAKLEANDCEEAKKLIRKIAGIKYEDL